MLGAIDASLIAPDNPFGMDPNDPHGQDDVLVAEPGAAPAARQAGQGAAALEGRAAQLHGAAVPRQDGHGAGHGHVPVAHADAGPASTRSSARNCAASGISPCAAGSSSTTPDAYQYLARRASRRSRRSQARPAADVGRRAGRVRGVRGLPWRQRARATRRSTRRSSPASRAGTSRGSCATSSTACAAARRATTIASADGGDRGAARRRRPSTTSSPTSRRCRTSRRTSTVQGDAARGASLLHDLRVLPRRRGPGHLVDECAAARRHERLVPGAAAAATSGRAIAAAHPQDFYGAQMALDEPDRGRQASATDDLVAYINTLR